MDGKEFEKLKIGEPAQEEVEENAKDGGEVEEEYNPLETVPEEVWECIFEKLYDPKDFSSVSEVSPVFENIILRKESEWLHPLIKVIPLVTRFLTKKDILNLRLASHRVCKAVERALRARPFQKYYTSGNRKYVAEFSGKYTSKCHHDAEMAIEHTELAEELADEGIHIFLAGSLHFTIENSRKFGSSKQTRFVNNFDLILCSLYFREVIEHVKISSHCNQYLHGVALHQMMFSILEHVRKIRTLEIEMPGRCFVDSDHIEWLKKDLKRKPFPELGHDKDLTIIFKKGVAPAVILEPFFRKYHAQLTSFILFFSKMEFDDETSKDNFHCPYLTKLSLKRFYNKSLPSLGRIYAPELKELVIDWRHVGVKDETFLREQKIMNMKRIGELIHTNFPKLRILTIKNIYPFMDLDACRWNMCELTCESLAETDVALERFKEHEEQEECHWAIIWKLLPPSVKVVFLYTTQFCREKHASNYN